MEVEEYALNFCRLCLREENLTDLYISPEEVEAVFNVGVSRIFLQQLASRRRN